MEYVTEYQSLPVSCERGYIVSVGRNKTLIIINENLTAEERRKLLSKIVRRFKINNIANLIV